MPLDGQQVVGDAPHGLQRGVGDVVGGQHDVASVGGAAPGQDGHRAGAGVGRPPLHGPVAHVDVELHVGQRHLGNNIEDTPKTKMLKSGDHVKVLLGCCFFVKNIFMAFCAFLDRTVKRDGKSG